MARGGNGMKIEQAIEQFEEQKQLFPHSYNVLSGLYGAAISALEKQLPTPPENKVHEKYKALGKNYYCKCGVMFVDFERNGTNYCGNCGQKLKGESE